MKQYNTSKYYEKKKLENSKSCPICGNTEDFKIINSYLVCMKCGLCQEIYCNSIYGFNEFTADDLDNEFIKALRELGDNGDKDDK